VIRDYGRGNRLIGDMMPDKLFHEIWHHVALTNDGIQMRLLLH
jgi:predicted Zn-dependent protease with MMP-like domain